MVEPTFDECWSCGADRETFEDRSGGKPPPAKVESPKDFADQLPPSAKVDPAEATNPYASPPLLPKEKFESSKDEDESDAEQDDLRSPPGEGDIQRAFRASILGIILCPPLLHLYSLILLLSVTHTVAAQSEKIKTQYYAALWIDIVAIVLAGLVLIAMIG
jgi:hypothetical protein